MCKLIAATNAEKSIESISPLGPSPFVFLLSIVGKLRKLMVAVLSFYIYIYLLLLLKRSDLLSSLCSPLSDSTIYTTPHIINGPQSTRKKIKASVIVTTWYWYMVLSMKSKMSFRLCCWQSTELSRSRTDISLHVVD